MLSASAHCTAPTLFDWYSWSGRQCENHGCLSQLGANGVSQSLILCVRIANRVHQIIKKRPHFIHPMFRCPRYDLNFKALHWSKI